MDKPLTVALAGNPNSGKTTIFNDLTGSRQHVGNYPGVTVEKKEGRCRHKGYNLNIVDLPGTYSLTAYSVEERAARDFLLQEKPDVVVDVIDASNLERNLYLATQLIELRVPLVLAFNMSDVAKSRGLEFDLERLSALLGAPIVPTVGSRGQGRDALLEAIKAVGERRNGYKVVPIHYGPDIDAELDKLECLLRATERPLPEGEPRWLALKLLENDHDVVRRVEEPEILAEAERSTHHLRTMLGDNPEIVVADRRYGFISGACQETVRSTVEMRHNVSDKVDAVLAHRLLGLPIFLLLMYVVFQLTFTLGEPPMGWIETAFGWMGNVVNGFWPKGSDSALRSLLVDGILGGVGGVVVFLPNIIFLFLAISLLEDSGYMARAAFVMDHIMHRFRLHGKSFIPMLIGFGCSVPAIMATRTLENERDRLTTMLVAPLMSCGARFPIYALIIPAFFPSNWRAPMLLLIYVIGIVLALLCAKLLRSTIIKGESTPFVMELPPYRLPTVEGTLIHMATRSWLYIKKAGTIILAISVVLWFLTTYPKKDQFDTDFDAKANAARAEYLGGVSELNSALGLNRDSRLLTEAVEAELHLQDASAAYHEYEGGYQQALAAKAATFDTLQKGDEGKRLTAFLTARQDILATRAAFESVVADQEIPAGSPAYLALEHREERELAEIASRDPEAYATALAYLDNLHARYQQTLDSIQAEKAAEDLSYSVAGRIGHMLSPLLKPMGFDWRLGTALIGAFAAKEVFVAQLGIVFAVGEADEESSALRSQLRAQYSPLTAFCIMLFMLIAAPCMATFAITKSESNSWKWASVQWFGLTAIGWIITVVVYQTGQLLGIGLT